MPFVNWWCALALWQTKAEVTRWLKYQNCWHLPTLTNTYWQLQTLSDIYRQVTDTNWHIMTCKVMNLRKRAHNDDNDDDDGKKPNE